MAHAALFGLALCLGSIAAPSLADSPLKRLTLRHDLLGFEAVGRLDFDNGFCSASLIAPDLVLTAAHCLIDTETGEKRDPHTATFRAGVRDGRAIAERSGLRAVAHPDYAPQGEDWLQRLTSDIALLQLDEPIPAGVAAPFAVDAPPQAGEAVSVVSYARQRSSAPSWQRECNILRQARGALEMSCDTDFGSSGAPVFDLSSGRPRIVSVVSQGTREGGMTRVYGMEAASRVAELKSALRSGRGVWPEREAPTARRLGIGSGAERSGAGGALFLKP